MALRCRRAPESAREAAIMCLCKGSKSGIFILSIKLGIGRDLLHTHSAFVNE